MVKNFGKASESVMTDAKISVRIDYKGASYTCPMPYLGVLSKGGHPKVSPQEGNQVVTVGSVLYLNETEIRKLAKKS